MMAISPNIFLINTCFPNSKLIIDCFHIVRHIYRIFQNHRITWTNQTAYQKNASLVEKRQDKQLKQYWKLFPKNKENSNNLN
ncbi:TPA: transposase [Enterococcus faecalis]